MIRTRRRLVALAIGAVVTAASLGGAGEAAPGDPPGDPGLPLQLSKASDQSVFQVFREAPDGSRIVYLGDLDVAGTWELYSVTATGGASTQLNPELVAGGDVVFGRYEVSPDSTRVVYMADQETDDAVELYSVPIGGGEAERLSAVVTAGRGIDQFVLTPDGQQVVYTADQTDDDVFDLYLAPIDGSSPPERLNSNINPDRDVSAFEVTPDGERVVYVEDAAVDEVRELFSVSLADGDVTKLHEDNPAGSGVTDMEVSDDSAWVAFLSDHDAVAAGVFEVYVVPTAGDATERRLHAAFGPTVNVEEFAITPDSAYVTYLADQFADGQDDLHAVRISDLDRRQLNGGLPAGGDVISSAVALDGGVVYVADQETDGLLELYATDLAGAEPTKISTALPPLGDVEYAEIAANGVDVVYTADARSDADNSFELFAVPLSGGVSRTLSRSLVSGGSVESWQLATDASRVLYSGDIVVDEERSLHVVSLVGGQSLMINGPGLETYNYTLSLNDRKVLFTGEILEGAPVGVLSSRAGYECRRLVATIVGAPGVDALVGTSADDVIFAGAGDDEIDGRGGDDVICGGGGADVVVGGRGADAVLGGAGDDDLRGGRGADAVLGGAGDDDLRGGRGADELNGGGADDTCAGGRGIDTARRCEVRSGIP